jgi:hypothetical protein
MKRGRATLVQVNGATLLRSEIQSCETPFFGINICDLINLETKVSGVVRFSKLRETP